MVHSQQKLQQQYVTIDRSLSNEQKLSKQKNIEAEHKILL